MKARRHAAILRILREHEVETQEGLVEHLEREGIRVTQATISRDLKELRLVKVPTGDGRYRYAPAREPDESERLARARRAVREYVTRMEASGNLVVVHTLPGTANAVAAALDSLNWPQVLGSVAGDDVILVVIRPRRRPRLDPACAATLEAILALRQGGPGS